MVRFAGDLRFEAGRRRHRSNERTVAGNEPVGHRKRRVGVGRDEASAIGDGMHGSSHHVVVKRLCDPHDHGVGGPVVYHGAASGSKGLEDTVGADGQDAIARVDHRRGCDSCRDDIRLGVGDSVRRELVGDLSWRALGRVGDEGDRDPSGSETGDRSRCAGNRLGPTPDDTVEVECPAGQLTSHVGRLRSRPCRSPEPLVSCAAAI